MNESNSNWPTVAAQNAHWASKENAHITSYAKYLDSNDNADLVVELVELYGFRVEETGGGCMWLRRDLVDGLHMVITDGEAGLPELTARLYIVSERTGGEPVAQSDLMTLHEMLDHVAHALDAE